MLIACMTNEQHVATTHQLRSTLLGRHQPPTPTRGQRQPRYASCCSGASINTTTLELTHQPVASMVHDVGQRQRHVTVHYSCSLHLLTFIYGDTLHHHGVFHVAVQSNMLDSTLVMLMQCQVNSHVGFIMTHATAQVDMTQQHPNTCSHDLRQYACHSAHHACWLLMQCCCVLSSLLAPWTEQ